MPSNDSTLLRVFDLLRFPLIIAVIFIHSYTFGDSLPSNGLHAESELYCLVASAGPTSLIAFQAVKYFISQILARTAVPLFFFMSGFLFYYRVETFSLSVYKQKMRRRLCTLLLPYVIWNILYMLLFLLLIKAGGVEYHRIPDFSLRSWLSAIVGFEEAGSLSPLAYQMWFIRDLFLCAILSPLIFYATTKTKGLWLAIVLSCWLLKVEIPIAGLQILSMTAIAFFSIGAYIALHKVDLAKMAERPAISLGIWLVLVATDLCTLGHPQNPLIHNLDIFAGIIAVFSTAYYLVDKRAVRAVPLLTSASFFVFAFHDPLLLRLVRGLTSMLPLYGAASRLLGYFAIVAADVALSLLAYRIMLRFQPRLLSLLNGNR